MGQILSTGVVPPQNIEAEQSLLGCLLMDGERDAESGQVNWRWMPVVMSIIDTDDFYRPSHQVIFETVKGMYDNGDPCDIVTMKEALRKKRKLESVGGAEYLFTLVETVPTAANTEYYARIVAEYSQQRKSAAILQTGLNAIMSGAPAVEILSEIETQSMKLKSRHGSDLWDINSVLETLGCDIAEALNPSPDAIKRGFSSGFPTMDKRFGKLGNRERYILLKARRGTGKTHTLVHLAVQAALSNRAVVIFTLEMSKTAFLQRMCSYVSGIDSHVFVRESREMVDAYMSGVQFFRDKEIFFCERGGISVFEIRDYCAALKSQGVDIGLIAVDYSEKVGRIKTAYSKEDWLSQMSTEFMNIAKQMRCTVVLLSQMNKEGGERGSEGLGNDADLILNLETDKENLKLSTEKNRYGPGFSLDLSIDKRTSVMGEINYNRDESAA